MKNWKYINGAEGVKIGNYGVSLDSAGARQVREMAAKLWTSGMHNSRDIAMAIAFEIAKTSKAMQENKADVVSNIQDMVDRWIKEVKTGNKMLKVGNKKAISSWFHMNKYGIEVGDWSWDWKNGAPEPSKQQEIERKIKSYVSQINKDVPNGESDERDEVFGKLDRFVRSQGLNKKICNDTPSEYAKRAPKIVGGNSLPEELEKDVEKKDKEKVDEINKLEKTENFKTGKSQLKPGDKVWSYGKTGIVKGVYDEYTDTIYGEPLIEVEFEDGSTKKIGEHFMRKVGNATSEYEILKQDPSKMHPLYKKAYEEAMKKLAREDEEFKKRFEREYGVKAKNEASDDKFAYVMREFEEGKLKTPDGKVVTDPAQAKAIAYSESKKTENGLARARNAIKK